MLKSIVYKTAFYALSFLISILSARLVNIEDLGLFTVLFSISSISIIFLSYGVETFVLKEFVEKNRSGEITQLVNDRFFSSIILSLFPAAVFIFLGVGIFQIFVLFSIIIMAMHRNLIANFLFSSLRIQQALMVQEGWQALIRLISLLFLWALSNTYLSGFDFTVSALIFSWFFGVLSSFLIANWIIRHKFRVSSAPNEIKKRCLSLYSKSKNYWFSQAIWTSAPFIDIFIVTTLFGVKDVAGYDISVKVAAATVFFSSILHSVVAPKISILWKRGSLSEIKKLLIHVSCFFGGAATIIFIVVCLMAESIMLIWGGDYVKYSDVLICVTLAQAIKLCFGALSPFLQMTDHSDGDKNIALLSLFVRIPTSIILGLNFGLIGVASAYIISTILSNVLLLKSTVSVFKQSKTE
ncbi:lipopolysaccharide biosynthesis protein [Vibrio crassostreae]|uniref:lipopolysaccharide biosynthesis protein n=1 Tax=Vibrio crassostreae TaxID=246167 RepID=UPI001B30564E|nr:oligosaccharide flippase family protein [Vibrio crassostreae]